MPRLFPKPWWAILATFAALLVLHLPLLRLPYYWDEAGYYVPAALDFSRRGWLIPASTLPSGHTPLVMIYLGVAWRVFGYSAWVARSAMTLVAAATVMALYALARHVAGREVAAWSAVLLALSPLYFAQTTLVHLDLAAALFTTLAVWCWLDERPGMFAFTASLAVLSKETAVVLLPVACLDGWIRARRGGGTLRPSTWFALAVPLVPLALWSVYYHHATGYWIGNGEYLRYNVYSTLSPARVFWSLLRRVYELFFSGFNWLLTGFAAVGIALRDTGHGTRGKRYETRDWGLGTRDSGHGIRDTGLDTRVTGHGEPTALLRADSAACGADEPSSTASSASADSKPAHRIPNSESRTPSPESRIPSFVSRVPCPVPRVPNPESRIPCPVSRIPAFVRLAAGLVTVYLILLSVVGGAILPRYLLPVMPLFYLTAVLLITRLPKIPARLLMTVAAACFACAWFINPPYPFPYEDNLAYADFIKLHQQAARFLEQQPGQPRILAVWPATDELTKPFLGYVARPLNTVDVPGFAPQDFAAVEPRSFDLLYLYSRRWELPGNWVVRFPFWLRIQGRYFDYQPQVPAETLEKRYNLRLLYESTRRGQWVRIYAKDAGTDPWQWRSTGVVYSSVNFRAKLQR